MRQREQAQLPATTSIEYRILHPYDRLPCLALFLPVRSSCVSVYDRVQAADWTSITRDGDNPRVLRATLTVRGEEEECLDYT